MPALPRVTYSGPCFPKRFILAPQVGTPPARPSRFVWRGRYEAVERESDALRQPYQGLARLLNCDAEEVAILQSATAAWTQARRRLRPAPHSTADVCSTRLLLDCKLHTLLPPPHTPCGHGRSACRSVHASHAVVSWALMILTHGAGACVQVFYGLELQHGDRILTSQHEYSSNFTAFLQARQHRCTAVTHACHALHPSQQELSFGCNPALSLICN